MGRGGNDRRRRIADQVTIGCTPVGVLLAAMAVVLAAISVWVVLVGPPEALRTLSTLWASVRRWWWLAASVRLAAAVLLAVAILLLLVRQRLRRLVKRLGGMAKRLYLWLLLDVLGRPVKEELAVRQAEARGVPAVAEEGRPTTSETSAVSAEGVGSWDECRAAVLLMDVPTLQVLYRPLVKYEQQSSIVVSLNLNALRMVSVGTKEHVSMNMVRDACKELRRAGFIKRHWTFSGTRGQAVRMRLADCLSGRAAARRVRESLSDELVNREVWVA